MPLKAVSALWVWAIVRGVMGKGRLLGWGALGLEARQPGAGVLGGKARGAAETRGLGGERISLLEVSEVRRLAAPSSRHRADQLGRHLLSYFLCCVMLLQFCVPPRLLHRPCLCPPGEVFISLRTKTPARGLNSTPQLTEETSDKQEITPVLWSRYSPSR